jgi:hypothetical protein
MAHWSRVITEDDAPEWVGVRHKDGTMSEVKVTNFDDHVHIHVASDKRVIIHDGTADR